MHLVQANGAAIPALGFGTWQLRGDDARRMVSAALEIGYRHVDTAQMYENETEVGEAIRQSGLPRADVFVTTKIWPADFRAADFSRAVEASMERLRLGWVDLLLLHWPSATVPLEETLDALDEAKSLGLAKHVGVSNFTTRLLEETLRLARSPIVTNQVEYHPLLSQRALLAFQRPASIALTAYSPVARGKVVGHPVIERIAAAHGRSAVQVTLRWLVQQDGVIAIPRSSSEANARANFEIDTFALTAAEMAEITAVGSPQGRLVDGSFAPEWDAD